ncbi:uncharacterized protein LOC110932340 [Helianthus annuus]|uniref:uncharacterized protein LOC110932340 n=1 Tax=Helianthus annuus TaxID=4232 RepID=UPI000B8F73B1|nr:uncharacterized protein LOC110932340 [Helianthus annuus]
MDDIPPLFLPIDISEDDDSSSSDSSLIFFQNLINEAAQVEDTGTSRKRKSVRLDRVKCHENLMRDYFVEEPVFNEEVFRQRFRMSKRLFLKILSDVQANNSWFQDAAYASGRKSFTSIQKVTSAIKQLATGNAPDEFDEYLNMSTRTSRESLEYFCETVCNLYASEFLRRPTSHDVALLYQAHEEKHHLPGMLGSLDCTHFVWRMYPTELRGQYMRGDHSHPTVMLEAVASQDLWIWHAFCGPAGSQNDNNVLQQSPLFLTERNGTAPKCPFYVNNHLYKRGYYLTDGIYPTWSVFEKSFPYPHIVKEKKFKRMVVYACIIMHNMILKDDGNVIAPVHIRDLPVEPVFEDTAYNELIDEDTHYRLKYDLIKHLGEQDLPHLLADSDNE